MTLTHLTSYILQIKLTLTQAIRATIESAFGEMHSINYTMDRVTFIIMFILAIKSKVRVTFIIIGNKKWFRNIEVG